jgi:hypothetical protein
MHDVSQELMTPHETARWFRRSPSWLRQQHQLVRLGARGGQPLFHVHVCRAFVLGRMCNLDGPALRMMQMDALAAACGLERTHPLLSDVSPPGDEDGRVDLSSN